MTLARPTDSDVGCVLFPTANQALEERKKEERRKVREDDKNVSIPKTEPVPPATIVSIAPEERKKEEKKQKTQPVPPAKAASPKEEERKELEDDNPVKTSTVEAVTPELEVEVEVSEDDHSNDNSNTGHSRLATSASEELDSLVDAICD